MFVLRWLGVAFALVSGLFTSQMPEYTQQYRQRLGGALDELHRMLADFDLDAKSQNLDRNKGIERMLGNADPLARQTGQRVANADVRAARLARQKQEMEGAGAFTRMFVLAKDYDANLARNAWADFKPALPLTLEGAITAVAGFFTGLGIWHLMGWPLKRRRRRLAAFDSARPAA